LASRLPTADLFTLVADPEQVPVELRGRRITTSWLQSPLTRRRFRWGLPLFPWTIEQFRFDRYDLVISISHAVAKGVRTNGVPHLCYCLTPMRYAWVCPDLYFGPAVQARWSPQRALVRYLQRWDAASADRVTRFVAISRTIQQRIRECYRRDAAVIYPPVECARFEQVTRAPQDYALVVSALVPYKRVELAIEVFNRLRRPLVIIGTGPDEARLRRLAGPTVRWVGRQSTAQLAHWYAGARALIYPQEEDFGLAAVEAQAAGCPVVALARGGATETVVDGVTGILFQEQTPAALQEAVTRCDRHAWDPAVLQRHARQFDVAQFQTAFDRLVTETVSHA